MQELTEITDVQKIQKASDALRTTIPAGVRGALKLKEGDQLAWDIDAENSKIFVRVTKKGEKK